MLTLALGKHWDGTMGDLSQDMHTAIDCALLMSESFSRILARRCISNGGALHCTGMPLRGESYPLSGPPGCLRKDGVMSGGGVDDDTCGAVTPTLP